MGQIIGIDSVIFIYLFEENPQYFLLAQRVLTSIENGTHGGVLSVVGMIEILTGPKMKEKFEVAYQYRELLKSFPNLTISGINERIVDIASDLRGRYRIATPDAIHIATAIDFGAKKFVTNDKSLKKIKEIKIEILA